jgi:transposase-like protein
MLKAEMEEHLGYKKHDSAGSKSGNTNPIESLNSIIRKYTKAKSLFPDDQAAMKAVFLAIQNVQKKWKIPIRYWGQIHNQFAINFDKRCRG